ncbi:MAG: helix-turn-helix transcriptional regulator [Lachnospiraceae bacterium]|nr:helix-turn-helix transcriptional regulator [Lachnospiraceae bacterium]
MAGVSQSYLRDIELENKNPTVAFISLLCEQLGISIADFFSDETIEKFQNATLLQQIYRLTPEQQTALISFLETIS